MSDCTGREVTPPSECMVETVSIAWHRYDRSGVRGFPYATPLDGIGGQKGEVNGNGDIALLYPCVFSPESVVFELCTGAASGAVRLEGSAAGEGCRIRAQLPEAEGRKVGAPQGVRRWRPPPGAKDGRDLPWGRMVEEVAALGA